MKALELALALARYAEKHGNCEVAVEYQTNEWYLLDPGEPLFVHAQKDGGTLALLNLADAPLTDQTKE